jgi:hypothetical protein
MGSNSKFTNYQLDKGDNLKRFKHKIYKPAIPGHPEHRKEIAE